VHLPKFLRWLNFCSFPWQILKMSKLHNFEKTACCNASFLFLGRMFRMTILTISATLGQLKAWIVVVWQSSCLLSDSNVILLFVFDGLGYQYNHCCFCSCILLVSFCISKSVHLLCMPFPLFCFCCYCSWIAVFMLPCFYDRQRKFQNVWFLHLQTLNPETNFL
jgi:hypothetical protein